MIGVGNRVEGLIGLGGRVEGLIGVGNRVEGLIGLGGRVDGWIGIGDRVEGWIRVGDRVDGWIEIGDRVDGWIGVGDRVEFLIGLGDRVEGRIWVGDRDDGWIGIGDRVDGDVGVVWVDRVDCVVGVLEVFIWFSRQYPTMRCFFLPLPHFVDDWNTIILIENIDSNTVMIGIVNMIDPRLSIYRHLAIFILCVCMRIIVQYYRLKYHYKRLININSYIMVLFFSYTVLLYN